MDSAQPTTLVAGQVVEVEVQTVAVFGMFCRAAEQDILILIPETSWIASFSSCHQFAEPGDRFLAKITHVDQHTGKIAATMKGQHPNPWESGQLTLNTEHEARVIRYVDKADRCNDAPGYLIELSPGAYAMLCADGLSLKKNQLCTVTIYESDSLKHSVNVIVTEGRNRYTFQQIVQEIVPQGKLLRTWPLKGGISAEMTALELEHPDGQTSRMIVRRPGDTAFKRNPHAAENEFKLLQTMKLLGLATQTPYYFDQSGASLPTPYLVIEYIDGQPEFAQTHDPDFARQLATHLARIHSVDSSAHDLSFLPASPRGFIETCGARPTLVNDSLDEGRIRDTLEAAWPWPQRNAPALLHGDFWPGNILWRNGQLVAVIDWEDATLGDPLIDLAISRLDLLWIFGIDAMRTFTQHYASIMALDYTNLPYWDLRAALRLVRLAGADLAEWAAFFLPFGRDDITEQTIRVHYRYFIDQAFEQLAM